MAPLSKVRRLGRLSPIAAAFALSACALPTLEDDALGFDDEEVAVTTEALSAPPDAQCAAATFNGHEYWFCGQNRTWAAARTQCQSKGLDLAHIDSSAENAFVLANLPASAWIGASDQSTEGAWRWTDNNAQFWSGTAGGSPVGGSYANWRSGQPDNSNNQDCGAIELTTPAGKWADRPCTDSLDFVCERALAVGEPGVACMTSGPGGSPWPSFRRCLGHQGASNVAGPRNTQLVKSYTAGGQIESSPAAGADGTIYFGSYDGYVYALKADLTLKWRYNTTAQVRSSPAVAADGTIVVGASNGKIYALNPNGTLKWSYNTGAAVRSSPAIAPDGNIYVGSDDGWFYSLTSAGTLRWRYGTFAAVRSSPAIGPDGTIYVGSEDWSVAALLPTGTAKWTFIAAGPISSSPAIGPDGTIYVGSYDGYLYALHPGTGAAKWWFQTPNAITSSPAIAPDGSIVFGNDEGIVRALNPSGTLKWSRTLGGGAVFSSAAIDAEGIIYVGSLNNSIYALNANGTVLWSLATGGDVVGSPAIAEALYVGSYDKKLYRIGGTRLREDAIVDQDCDGIEDSVETAGGLSPTNPDDANLDADQDGLTNGEELLLGGNPNRSDTDNDLEADGTDLLRPLDLDGDGKLTPNDNCPKDTNPDQRDSDGDSIGDVCDSAPKAVGTGTDKLVTIHMVRHMARKDYALRNTSERDPGRLKRDLNGFLSTGNVVRIFGAPATSTVAVTELHHAFSGRHAYAAGTADVNQWKSIGFTVIGTLGYVTTALPTYGDPVRLRRFVKTGGEQIVTFDDAHAQALLAAGYTESVSLGYAFKDQGRLRKAKPIVRFRKSGGSTLHTMQPNVEVSYTGYATEGERFQILPEPSGWAVPLYRLRNTQGFEVLSSSSAELTTLQSAGFALEGVIGWIYRDETISTLDHVARLTRVKKSGRYEHTADPTELASLVSQGYTEATVLGRVVRIPAEHANPLTCRGHVAPLSGLEDRLAGAAPGVREIAALRTIVAAYTMQRVLTGKVVSPTEQSMAAAFADVDPETRARLLRDAQEVLDTSAAVRAALLGLLAPLDPTGGNAPVNYHDIDVGVTRQAQSVGVPVSGNYGLAPGGSSLMRIRAPHCEGVTYAGGDPEIPGRSARAVTTASRPTCGAELCPTKYGEYMPKVFGVLANTDSVAPTGNAAQTFAEAHPEVGYNLGGTEIGPCNPDTCLPVLGQRCLADKCYQYPVIKHGSFPTFTGMNFWDNKSSYIILTSEPKTSTETPVETFFTEPRVDIDPIPMNSPRPPTDSADRCDVTPTRPMAPASVEGKVERIISTKPLALNDPLGPGYFYKVQVTNVNGSLYRWGDVLDMNPAVRVEPRTIHLCVPPFCMQTPAAGVASCEQEIMPKCGGAVGGTWLTPPRSKKQCEALFGGFYEEWQCPETPRYFMSDATADGRPALIYMAEADPTIYVQTSLASVHCKDETGGDALGDDELVVWMGTFTNPPAVDYQSVSEFKETHSGTHYIDGIAAHTSNFPRKPMTGVPVPLSSAGQFAVVTIAAEDDDWGIENVVAGFFGSYEGSHGGAAAGGAVGGQGGAIGGAIAGGIIGFAGGFYASLPLHQYGDHIGTSVWQGTVQDVVNRAQLARDGRISPGATLVLGTDPERFQTIGTPPEFEDRIATKHPAVDLVGYSSNQDIITCTVDANCPGKKCVMGACVPLTWVDLAIPAGTPTPGWDLPGVIEKVHLDDEGIYDLYIATSLSDESGQSGP